MKLYQHGVLLLSDTAKSPGSTDNDKRVDWPCSSSEGISELQFAKDSSKGD